MNLQNKLNCLLKDFCEMELENFLISPRNFGLIGGKSLSNDVNLRLNWIVYGCLSFSGFYWSWFLRHIGVLLGATLKKDKKKLP